MKSKLKEIDNFEHCLKLVVFETDYRNENNVCYIYDFEVYELTGVNGDETGELILTGSLRKADHCVNFSFPNSSQFLIHSCNYLDSFITQMSWISKQLELIA